MGLWNRMRKTKKKTDAVATPQEVEQLIRTPLEKFNYNGASAGERKAYVTQNCQQIIETTKQLEEFSKEYQVVTSYLSDIQVIDSLPEEARKAVDDSARMIITLTRERQRYQNHSEKLTQKQLLMLETYEDSIPDEIRKINHMEAYQTALNSDLAKLEGEKSSLLYHMENLYKRKNNLKHLGIFAVALITLLLCLIIYLMIGVDKAYEIPLIVTVLISTVCTVALGLEITNIRGGMAKTERKIGKAIGLLNRVKIKYINNRCALDYVYEKFGINSSSQLTYFWEEYMKQKEEDKKFKKNTELLNYYSEKLIKDLKQYQIRDCEVWTHQAIALLDSKELVEIRHRLNVRRQKLRERMDYNTTTRNESIENIKEVLKSRPEAREEIIEVLVKYHIEI